MVQNKFIIPDSLIHDFSTYAQSNRVSIQKLWLVTFQVFLHRLTQENRIPVLAPDQSDGSWGVFSADFANSILFSELHKRESTPQAEENLPIQFVFQYQSEINIPIPEKFDPILKLELGQTAIWNSHPAHYSADEIACFPQIFIHFCIHQEKLKQ